MSVVISVPHGKCVDEVYRDCDQRAYDAAMMLEKKLGEYQISTIVHVATDLRAEYDNNRAPARSKKWREDLRSIWKKEKPSYHVDMHSFVTIINPLYKCDFTAYQICVLDDVHHPSSLALTRELIASGLKSCLVEGTEVNDIMMEARELDIQSIMIENNENKETYSNSELQTAMSVLARWLRNEINKQKK